VLRLVRSLRSKIEQPLVLMGYANVFLAMGEKNFAVAAKEVGVDGVITVDLPPEEGELFFDSLIEYEVDPILLASPTTSEARLASLAEKTRGFLYYVSLTGVTGARKEMAAGLEEAVLRIRRISDVPVCVGFGVSTPEQVSEIGRFADGVVVGSALVDLIEAAETPGPAVASVSEFVAKLKHALR
jgi:tryptophan synthase alpha chain